MKGKSLAIGVDLGGTKVEVAHVDRAGHVVRRIRTPTDVKGGAEAVIHSIVASANSLQKEGSGDNAVCVGVGMAGQIDAASGVVRFAPNLGWHHVPLQEELQKVLRVPVLVTNDVRAATWGEWLYGAGKGCDDLICLFVGTGIGGGVVSGGRMLTGHANCAGEFGHLTVDMNGRKCHCGNFGCMEALAGGRSLGEIARGVIAKEPKLGKHIQELAGENLQDVTAKHVVQAAKNGDPLGKQLLEDVVRALVAGVVSLVNAFNPERMIFSGGVINGMPEILEAVDKGVRKLALKASTEHLQIMHATLKEEAGVIGSAAMALHHFAKEQGA